MKQYGRVNFVLNRVKKDQYNQLLDVGCYNGKETALYRPYARTIEGIDPETDAINTAISQFPDIHFVHGVAEELPYETERFDCIVFSDVLEHVQNDKVAITEIWRVLAPGGKLILTTPHKGLFSFLDPLNYGYYLKKYLPFLPIKEKVQHRHYSKSQILNLFSIQAQKQMEIVFVKRPGLVIMPLLYNIQLGLKKLPFNTKTIAFVDKIKHTLGEWEYQIDFGRFGYYIGIEIQKINNAPNSDTIE